MIKKFLFGSLALASMCLNAKEHGNRAGEVIFDHSGDKYAVTGADFVLIDKEGVEQRLLNSFQQAVIAADFSKDDKLIAAIDSDIKTLKIHDLSTREIFEYPLNGYVEGKVRVLFAGQENILLVGCSLKVEILKFAQGKFTKLAELKAGNNVRAGFDLGADLKYALFNGQRYQIARGVKKWEFKSPSKYPRINGTLNENRLSEDGSKALFLHSGRKLVSEIDVATGEILKTINLTKAIGDFETNAKITKAFFEGGVLDVKRGKVSPGLTGDIDHVNCNEAGDTLSVGVKIKKADGKVLDLTAARVYLDDLRFEEKGSVLALATETHKYKVNLEYKFVSTAPVDNLGRKKVGGMLGYSSDGHYGVDSLGRVYDYQNRAYLRGALLGRTNTAHAAAISVSGVVALLTDREIRFYNLVEREALGNFKLESSVAGVSHSFMEIDKYGKNLIINYTKSGKTITFLVDVDRKKKFPLMSEFGQAHAAIFKARGDLLVASGKDIHTIYTHADKSYLDEKATWSIESGSIESMFYEPLVKKLAVRNANGQVDVYDKDKKKLITLSQSLGKYELSTED